jgi:hypothetical protein
MTRKIDGQFAPRLIEMLRSPAFRALSLSGHRILTRIEIELAGHGGKDNGKLPVTFQNFHDFGIHRDAIAPAIREAVALGWIRLTQAGRSGNGEFRRPNMFALTHLPTNDEQIKPTDEWQRLATVEEAMAIAEAARKVPSRSRKKQKTSHGNRTETTPGNRTERPHSPHPETGPLQPPETGPLSISRGGSDGGAAKLEWPTRRIEEVPNLPNPPRAGNGSAK